MTTTPERRRLSGWCMAAPGARKKCAGCRMDVCQCDCHAPKEGDS